MIYNQNALMAHTRQSGYHAASKGEGGLLCWEAIMSDMFIAFVNDQQTCSAEDEHQKFLKNFYYRVISDEELLLEKLFQMKE